MNDTSVREIIEEGGRQRGGSYDMRDCERQNLGDVEPDIIGDNTFVAVVVGTVCSQFVLLLRWEKQVDIGLKRERRLEETTRLVYVRGETEKELC